MKNKIEPEFEMNGSPKDFDKPNLRIKIPVSKDDDYILLSPTVKRITSENNNCTSTQEKISLVFIICTYLVCYPCILKYIC
jgi:hypothetical protein